MQESNSACNLYLCKSQSLNHSGEDSHGLAKARSENCTDRTSVDRLQGKKSRPIRRSGKKETSAGPVSVWDDITVELIPEGRSRGPGSDLGHLQDKCTTLYRKRSSHLQNRLIYRGGGRLRLETQSLTRVVDRGRVDGQAKRGILEKQNKNRPDSLLEIPAAYKN
ncbi:hypothetical protein J6590_037196 [Homalodisca vitripennis]|nr:hypothetical protein J6590_037196 [Homalodisca vitripennis]